MYSALLCLLLPFAASGEEYVPSPGNLENREWFQDAKFGLFVHWGIYSTLAEHEWVMETESIDRATYEKLAAFFNPTAFDAEEWVLMAKDAGMKYITITSKHHDGFAMYDSAVSGWDIVDRTPYGKDVLAQLAQACREHGLKLFFYYSQLDWHHPDYFPRGSTGHAAGRPAEGDWDAYIDYMNTQLEELLTNYGDIAGIWFDGWWDRKDADWRLDETYSLIHSLQPDTMIGSNHHQAPKPGEDFQMFEKDLPGHNTAGYSADAKIGTLPLETAETMAERWGFSLQDQAYKSTEELITYLVRAAGYDSNFLLNVGPMPNGKIQPEFVATLGKIGDWMDRYGDTIYETRGGPVPPQSWGVTTHKDDRVFVHVLDEAAQSVVLPDFGRRVEDARAFGADATLDFEVTGLGTVIDLPDPADGPVRIVELSVAR